MADKSRWLAINAELINVDHVRMIKILAGGESNHEPRIIIYFGKDDSLTFNGEKYVMAVRDWVQNSGQEFHGIAADPSMSIPERGAFSIGPNPLEDYRG